MIKRTPIVFLFLAIGFLFGSPKGWAYCDPDLNACVAFNEVDQRSGPYDICSLRKQVRWYNAGGAEAICAVPAGSADEEEYDQGIYFMTPQWDFEGFFENHVDDWIVLQRRLDFNNGYLDVAVGNWSAYTDPATAYNYGIVKIDAKTNGLEEDEIFHCGASQGEDSVTLRNMIISTDGITKQQMFDAEPCLRDGGAVYMCYGDLIGTPTASPASQTGWLNAWCDRDGDGFTVTGGDCVGDNDAARHPGVAETCANLGVDNDCDGSTTDLDSGQGRTYYRDVDGDGYGRTSPTIRACSQPAGYADNNDDCNDTTTGGAINPDAEEVCDGVDNDCDGTIDRPDCECLNGATQSCGSSVGACESGLQTCTDGTWGACDGAVGPSAEVCGNGIDEDCSGADLACPAADTDDDGDGYFEDGDDPGDDCAGSVDGVSCDCDDTNPDVSPGDVEICGDGIDQDCSGADLACPAADTDDDGDGYFEDGDDPGADCAGSVDGVSCDCDDTNPDVSPGDVEICGDGIDQDCSGADLACPAADADDDGDGYFEDGDDPGADCAGSIEPGVCDCDDENPAVNPGVIENCEDGIDNNCDGEIDDDDEACDTSDTDDDDDGYFEDGDDPGDDCADSIEPGVCDCDDSNPAINPGEAEICDDGLDNDCNELTDGEEIICTTGCDNFITIWRDADNDDFGNPDESSAHCAGDDIPDGYVDIPGDCNDFNPTTNPDAAEVCEDTTDNDCDGSVDEGCAGDSTVDNDGDGFCEDLVACSDGTDPGDCDDTNAGINPRASESCGDSFDNNCDGLTDIEDPVCQVTPIDEEFCPMPGNPLNPCKFTGGAVFGGCSLQAAPAGGNNLMILLLLLVFPLGTRGFTHLIKSSRWM